MTVLQQTPNSSSQGRVSHSNEVANRTAAQIHVFLTEVAKGVSNYRSMHSLTEQVEHQYHGRFLIELIQNAHDALQVTASSTQSNRIKILFDPQDSDHGTLFVANDGRPFTKSNFERISQLGQSDKDPQESIGNKGIGFRSVLEISDSPEVYSRATSRGKCFDGYCFAFRPSVVESLAAPIEDLSIGRRIPIWSVTGLPIVEDWPPGMVSKFQQRVRGEASGWLRKQLKFLSPYLLPVPIVCDPDSRTALCEKEGFATVVRLPLKSRKLREYVLQAMRLLSVDDVFAPTEN